ncbi:S1C family serine protease [Massilia sp. B-10]|nr:S1C family serine protease [Massilia sp. B-10]
MPARSRFRPTRLGDKVSATVVAVSRDMDLAILKLDDESFFDTHAPVARASVLPNVRDQVFAYGYPTGGSSLSITKGIVSRIEFVGYSRDTAGLRIQIDAAINPGNSGGPAIMRDTMVGLAFGMASNAQNIGYIIPNEEVELFLKDVADGRYDGKPALLDETQTLENPVLRTFLKLDKSVAGTVVQSPGMDNASYPLKEWDVITKIGDSPIDNQSMISLGANLRVRFQYRVQQLAKNGKVPLTIIRAKQGDESGRAGIDRAQVADPGSGRRLSFVLCVWTDRVLAGDVRVPVLHDQ